jgi:hypothetical protein
MAKQPLKISVERNCIENIFSATQSKTIRYFADFLAELM